MGKVQGWGVRMKDGDRGGMKDGDRGGRDEVVLVGAMSCLKVNSSVFV